MIGYKVGKTTYGLSGNGEREGVYFYNTFVKFFKDQLYKTAIYSY